MIEEHENAALAPKSAPKELFVQPFGYSKDAPFDAAAGGSADEARAKIGKFIAEGVASRGTRWIAPAEVLEAGQVPPPSGLLVKGRILVIRQGSRALRLGIGLGAGRTRMETTVRVYNLDASAEKPWLTFKTTGGSNMEPGVLPALVVPSPVTIPIVVGAVGGAAASLGLVEKGVSQDAKRTGRTIAAAVHDYLVAHKLMRRKAWPKRATSLGTPVGQLPIPQLD